MGNGSDLLETVREKAPDRLDWRDIFAVKDDAGVDNIDTTEAEVLDAYFRAFVKPDGKCLGCGARLAGDMFQSAFGLTSFEWGIANGEGHCSHCRYPARAYHRNVGPIEFLNVVLQYHPDELKPITTPEQ